LVLFTYGLNGRTSFDKSIYPKSKVKTTQAPTFVIKFLSLLDGEIKAVLPLLGKPMITSGAKASQLLGIKFIPVEVTFKESADYLLDNASDLKNNA